MEFKKHYSRIDLERLFDGEFQVPESFLLGTASSAFQVEGGYNRPGEPLNNWLEFERSGRVETSGEAARFWDDHRAHLELAARTGQNSFRMSVEWARIQPGSTPTRSTVPAFDQRALEKYSDIIADIMKLGMEPVITLHHFTHPRWLGPDFWLENQKLGLFRNYVEKTVGEINRGLADRHSLRPVRYWVTLNEPNALCLVSYLVRRFPHRRGGLAHALKSRDNMLDAHCRAYDSIHRIYRENQWPSPMVSYNTFCISTYHLDRIFTDLLLSRQNGTMRIDLDSYIEDCRCAWEEEVARAAPLTRAPLANRSLEKTVNRIMARKAGVESFPNGIKAIYSSPQPRKLDYLAIDYYDPWLRHMLKAPSGEARREKNFSFGSELWEQVLNPAGLDHFLKAASLNSGGLPVYVLENGMCYRGEGTPRQDGATIDRFLQCNLYEVMRALKDGIPVNGYFYWTLVDNYEWGSYQPRFGLYSLDRSAEPVGIRMVDALGIDSGSMFAALAGALMKNDRELVIDAFEQVASSRGAYPAGQDNR